ncbi:MAG: YbaB/EbfC family nucleoid-associated protein [Tissierellia bacterium]|nr:YbaB/EbfC family nucleoid-associated protein [Tissierellia bacterium]
MAKKRGGYPNMGGMNMQGMMKQVQKMQEDMLKAQEEAEKLEFDVSVGGGAVKLRMNGKKELLEISIDDDLLDPEEKEMLQDLLLTAVNEIFRKTEAALGSSMEKVTGGLNIPGL